jgi:hypothetical protein
MKGEGFQLTDMPHISEQQVRVIGIQSDLEVKINVQYSAPDSTTTDTTHPQAANNCLVSISKTLNTSQPTAVCLHVAKFRQSLLDSCCSSLVIANYLHFEVNGLYY